MLIAAQQHITRVNKMTGRGLKIRRVSVAGDRQPMLRDPLPAVRYK